MATIKKTVVEKHQKERKKAEGPQVTCLHCKKQVSSSQYRKVKTDICHKDFGLCMKCGSQIVNEQEEAGLKLICELLNVPFWQASYDSAKAFHADTFETYTNSFYSGALASKRYAESDMFKAENIGEAVGKKKKKKFKKLEIEDLDLEEMWDRWGVDTDENDFVALETHFIKLKGHEAATDDDVNEIVGLSRTEVILDEAFRERDVKNIEAAQKLLNAQKKLRLERIKERGDNSLTSLGVAAKLLEYDRPINLQPGKYTDEFAIKYFKRFVVHHLQTMLGLVKRNEVDLLEGESENLFEMEKDL